MVLAALLAPGMVYAATVGDYLILNDIGQYDLSKPEKMFVG
jgi:hypothetical protein